MEKLKTLELNWGFIYCLHISKTIKLFVLIGVKRQPNSSTYLYMTVLWGFFSFDSQKSSASGWVACETILIITFTLEID